MDLNALSLNVTDFTARINWIHPLTVLSTKKNFIRGTKSFCLLSEMKDQLQCTFFPIIRNVLIKIL